MPHAARINLFTLAPSALKAMGNLSQTVKQGPLGPRLV
ncbi:MAG: carboxymuconolactone decarboxylase family protein, partial [Massilia sp.]|nr:carboxymuconolactone decarboxylase family protein [Massilia sp.]